MSKCVTSSCSTVGFLRCYLRRRRENDGRIKRSCQMGEWEFQAALLKKKMFKLQVHSGGRRNSSLGFHGICVSGLFIIHGTRECRIKDAYRRHIVETLKEPLNQTNKAMHYASDLMSGNFATYLIFSARS